MNILRNLLMFTAAVCVGVVAVDAQTSVFNYQGRLIDGGSPANGSYDMRFRLFSTAAGGVQVGSDVSVNSVPTAAGIFNVEIDFGVVPFSGAERFLEVAISPAGQNNFTTLAPRQKLNSSPYSIQALNADTSINSLNLGGVTANQFVVTTDARMSDARTPLPGSGDYVQNGTVAQPNIGFNVGGTGTAGVFNAGTQFNLGGSRILSNQGTDNLFAGIGAGAANTNGQRNAFFGRNAGNASTGSNDSTFFGANAGLKQTISFANSFFGSGAGQENINGNSLAFFGTNAGNKNVTGVNNSFYGNAAGQENTSGSFNTFLGFAAGFNNTTGNNNIFIGNLTGNVNAATQVNNSIAVGNNVRVSTSNTIVLGTTSHDTQIPGQVTAGKLVMSGGVPIGGSFAAQSFSNLGFSGIYTNNLLLDNNALNNVLPSQVPLCIRTTSIGGGLGGEMLTRCTATLSSAKDRIEARSFSEGLDVIERLKPIVFKRKTDGPEDVGLDAENVAEAAPRAISRNEKGEAEGVNENVLQALLINSIKQQQAQIELLRKQIERLNRQIDEMRAAMCASNAHPGACKGN